MAGLGTEGDRIHPPRSQACHGVRSCSLRPMRYATTSRCSRWEPRVLELRCVVKNLPHVSWATVDTNSEKRCVNMLFTERRRAAIRVSAQIPSTRSAEQYRTISDMLVVDR